MNEKKIYKRITKYLIFLILFIIMFFFYKFFTKNIYFKIPSFKDSFYIIPKDKGGQTITNQDKKGLHLSYNNNENIDLINDDSLNFSIQLFSNANFSFIEDKREELLKIKDTIYLPYDLFIVALKNDLGIEYLLLYKNFTSRLEALEYCKKYAYFLDNCLILNVKNID